MRRESFTTTYKMAIDRVKYWIDLADYDLGTAEDLFQSRRWVYVAFMCHQVIEKTLKAYWCATQENDPPYIHHLANLAIRSSLYEQMTEAQQEFIALLMPMNIEARYPEYKQKLASSLNKDSCLHLINETKNLQQWIKNKL